MNHEQSPQKWQGKKIWSSIFTIKKNYFSSRFFCGIAPKYDDNIYWNISEFSIITVEFLKKYGSFLKGHHHHES